MLRSGQNDLQLQKYRIAPYWRLLPSAIRFVLSVEHNGKEIRPYACQYSRLNTSTQVNLPPSQNEPVSHSIILFGKNCGTGS